MFKHFWKGCFVLLLLSVSITEAQQLDMARFKNIKPRNIGPAATSGRVTAIDAVHENPNIIYVGTASGGLWKSEGGGVTWQPIFDKEKAASIGAIAIDQTNPQVIWVGTGEGNPRNSQSNGNGVYKSIDGGRSWQHLGLEATSNIHRIIINKNNPNVVYVAALGTAWGDTKDRGVYRTSDGGKSWEKILYVNERTGASELVVDPANPNKMLVNMWEYRRWPWHFKSGGAGSGLYMTLDGGNTWTKKTSEDGLPEGELGKIGLAIARSNPKIIYALIESKKNALYRSEDGGFSWNKVADKNIGDRPFYYADLAVDPANENRLYNVFSNVTVSEDGGKTFKTLLGWDRIHGDHHFWWIHPQNPNLIMNGNDGGLAISRDRGTSWRFVENLPVTQFYHIAVDMDTPYNVMGGTQDNGTFRGPSKVWRNSGIRNSYWEEIAFGDGFDVVTDLDNNRYGYGMWQGGNLMRLDYETGASKFIKPVHPNGEFLRFNWNAAIARDPHNPKSIYFGSQYLHKSTDEGQSWQIISPDLTTNDPEKQKQNRTGGLTYDITGAENHTTIMAIAPSSLKQGVVWVGTDDGNIQLTQDGGKSWKNVADNIKGYPKGAWVPQITASRHKEGEAFVVVNDYRRNNLAPYLYHTTDYGKTWKNLVSAAKVDGYTLSFTQDPVAPKLMFLGTEGGLYTSIDAGANWAKWTAGYPNVSTMDMVIHPREHDLAIATFGRSMWILDDIRPLREIAQQGTQLLDEAVHVYSIPDAYLVSYREAGGTRFHGDAMYQGENQPFGAQISYSVKEVKTADKKDTVYVEVSDAAGKLIRHMQVKAEPGMNRFFWSLEHDAVKMPGASKQKENQPLEAARLVSPGEYTVKVINGDAVASSKVQVKTDPRLEADPAALQQTYALLDEFTGYVKGVAQAVTNLQEAKASVDAVVEKLEGAEKVAMQQQGEKLKKQLDLLLQKVIPAEDVQGIFEDPALISVKIGEASSYFNSPFGSVSGVFAKPTPVSGAPTEGQKLVVARLGKEVKAYLQEVNNFFQNDWNGFVKQTDQIKITRDYQPIGL
jgi:photosystem II stability/assembly factor-like uncharacterized protein